MLKNLQICILILVTQLVFSQKGEISGQIFDDSGEILTAATVYIPALDVGCISDDQGNYILKDLPIGEYQLEISYIGYETIVYIFEISANSQVHKDFILIPFDQILQGVEIIGRRATTYKNAVSYVGTKTATALKNVPQAISYVTKEVISDQQAYRIGEIVKNISGVNMFSGYDDFTVRGFRSGSSDQKMINGLRSVGIFGPQPILANIERVEVIKGPASALFANTVPGGTINYVTKKPLNEDRKALNFTTGSFNTLRATADFTGPMNKEQTLLYRINLGYESGDSFRDLQQNNTIIVAPSFSFLPTKKTKLNFDLVISKYKGKLDRGQPIFGAESGTNLKSTPISFAIGEVNDFHFNDVNYFTLSLNHQLTEKLTFNTSYMRFSWSEDLFEHRTSNAFAVDIENNQLPTLMGMQVINRIRKQVSDNISNYFVYSRTYGALKIRTVAGFDYISKFQPLGGGQSRARGFRKKDGSIASSYDAENSAEFEIEDNRPVPNIPHFDLKNPKYYVSYSHEYKMNDKVSYPATKYYNYGIYLQGQIEWNAWKGLFALRQELYRDFESYKKPEEKIIKQDKLLPRIGLVYSLNQHINLYGTFTESYQPQNVVSLTNPDAGGPFDPLTAKMWEIGAKTEWLSNNSLGANLALYYLTQNNILVNANKEGSPDLLEQRGQEKSTGLEIDILGQILPHWSVTANYAYNDARVSRSDDEKAVGRIKENAPFHQGGIWTKYILQESLLQGLGIGIGVNFVSERVTFDTYTLGLKLPAYMITDVALYYSVDKFKLAVNLNNVFDTTHWTGGYSYVRLFPGTPRNMLVSLSYTF